MSQFTEEIKKKVVKQHIQDGRTIASLSAEYGASKAAISNWVHNYSEECQTKDVYHKRSALSAISNHIMCLEN